MRALSLHPAALLLALPLFAGCLDVTPPEGRLVCTAATVDVDCPDGWACSAGFCYREPQAPMDAGSDAGGDAGTDGGTDAGTPCTDAAECDDENACSVDTCEGNVCVNTFQPTLDPDLADDAGADSNCDGVDGVAASDLYVVAGGSGTGRPNDPVDLATALSMSTGSETIFVAAGDHLVASALTVSADVAIHGGYATSFASRPGQSRLLSSGGRALVISNVSSVIIEQLDLVTANASTPGASTQTLTVVGSNVTLRRLAITAGNAGGGSDGMPGAPGTPPAAAGPNGSNGSGTAGGAGASCGTSGGQGAGSSPSQPAVVGNSSAVVSTGCGAGGATGGSVNDNRSCTAGDAQPYVSASTNGAAGQPGCPQSTLGSAGDGATGAGTLASDGAWERPLAVSGGDGPNGNSGGGGGGGTTYARANDSTCSSSAINRAAGGGGGCGGIGGDGGGGGQAGQSGGASIGIAARDSDVVLESVLVTTGDGGNGGRGGDGGLGAAGVAGSAGGVGGTVTSFGSAGSFTHRGGTGGGGGTGSAGANGGCGGGGAGGWSIGVFLSGTATVDANTATFAQGTPGVAGPACAAGGGNPGSAGAAMNVSMP